MNVGVSSIGYSNATSGPIAISASTAKGISVGSLPSTGTRQIRPPYDITSASDPGVKEYPGSTSIVAVDSMSSR